MRLNHVQFLVEFFREIFRIKRNFNMQAMMQSDELFEFSLNVFIKLPCVRDRDVTKQDTGNRRDP